jgi:hypothetical protein
VHAQVLACFVALGLGAVPRKGDPGPAPSGDLPRRSPGDTSRRKRPEGLILEQRTTHRIRTLSGMVEQEEEVRVSFSPKGVRVEPAESNAPTIYRVESDGRVTRIEVFPRRKVFREEDLARRRREDEALARSMRSGRDAGMAGLAGLFGGGGGARPADAAGPEEAAEPAIQVRRIERKRVIARKRCRGLEFLREGEKVFESWYTEDPAPVWLRRFDLEEPPRSASRELVELREREPGVELESVHFLPAGGRYEVKTVRVTQREPPRGFLEPPRGYRRIAPPGSGSGLPAGHGRAPDNGASGRGRSAGREGPWGGPSPDEAGASAREGGRDAGPKEGGER